MSALAVAQGDSWLLQRSNTSLAVTSAKPSCQACLPPRRKPRGAPPAPLPCTEEAAVSHSGTLCCSRTAAKEGEALTPASPTSTANAPSSRKASARYVSGHTCDHDGVAARRDSGEIGSVMLLQGDNASLAAHVHGPCLLLAMALRLCDLQATIDCGPAPLGVAMPAAIAKPGPGPPRRVLESPAR